MRTEQPRPMVVFFPWVTLETSVTPSGLELRPYHVDDPVWSDDVRHILNTYERCAGQSVRSATIVVYEGEVGGAVREGQLDATFAFREALSFAALRRRQFFSGDGYCNDHTLHCVAQAYVPGSPGVTAISRRRDGRSMTYLGEDFHRVICPPYVSAGSQLAIDGKLLRGLLDAMADPACDWVGDGIELFNMANTDSPQLRSHNEVLLSVAAAQRLLGVTEKSDAKALAQCFADTLYSATASMVNVADCLRLRPEKAKSIAQGWFYDLYSA